MTSTLKKWPIFSLLEPEFVSNIHMVLVYGELGNSCLIVTKDQMVYALGKGCENCVTTDWVDDEGIVYLRKIDRLCGKKIKTMAYGEDSYVLVLTENGVLYSWGTTICSSLRSTCYPDILKPIKLKALDNLVVDIACGSHHSMALTSNGNVYVWGESTTDQKWVQFSRTSRVNPDGLDVLFRFISCGANHCVAVTDNGHVYSWGCNRRGQLGFGDIVDQSMPRKVAHFTVTSIVIEKVVCGKNHTLALSTKGTLYSWGCNQYGQLGVITEKQQFNSIPIALSCSMKVLDMAASYCADISVAMVIEHQIFVWGMCLLQSITIPTLTLVDSIHDAFALYASPTVMHQPFVIDNEDKKEEDDIKTTNVMDDIMAAFDDKTTSDLTIEVKGKPIYVHKLILKIHSEYFNAMLQGDWKENKSSVVRICEFSYVAYRTFLKFLYTNETDATLPTENVFELLQLADIHDKDNLKARYTDVLMRRISTANTALFYSGAVQYNNPGLRERCIIFAATRMREISKSSSFSELTLETMRNFIIEVGDQGAFKSKI